MATEGPSELETNQEIAHPLTSTLKKIDLSDVLQDRTEIVKRGTEGPKTLDEVLMLAVPVPEASGVEENEWSRLNRDARLKREAILARITAKGFTDSLFRAGDAIVIAGGVMSVETHDGKKYDISLRDEKLTDKDAWKNVESRADIKQLTRRAWGDLMQAADQGILFNVLRGLGYQPKDKATRTNIWAAMAAEAGLTDTLRKHPQLKKIPDGFLKEKYTGSAAQNRAMIEYLRGQAKAGALAAPRTPEAPAASKEKKPKTIDELEQTPEFERVEDFLNERGFELSAHDYARNGIAFTKEIAEGQTAAIQIDLKPDEKERYRVQVMWDSSDAATYTKFNAISIQDVLVGLEAKFKDEAFLTIKNRTAELENKRTNFKALKKTRDYQSASGVMSKYGFDVKALMDFEMGTVAFAKKGAGEIKINFAINAKGDYEAQLDTKISMRLNAKSMKELLDQIEQELAEPKKTSVKRDVI